MKTNERRKVFDAVDLLTEDVQVENTESDIQLMEVDKIRAFHNHPFRMYEGERLNDMVESIQAHGILNPVIVHKSEDEYEMLSGHNRWNVAKIAGINKIPAIVKEGLSEEEAYIYVIETNLMQRDLLQICCRVKRHQY